MSELASPSEFEAIHHIRQRPGMYIGEGGTHLWALHYLLYQVIDNAVNQAQSGNCTHLWVTLHSENTVTIRDDGPGIPVTVYEEYGRSILERV